MPIAELQTRAIQTVPFGAPIELDQLPPLQGRTLEMPTVAQARVMRTAASVGLNEVTMLADITDNFGMLTESAFFAQEEPGVIYCAPAEQWAWKGRGAVLRGFLGSIGLDPEHALRNDVQTQGDRDGTVVYFLSRGGNDHLLTERNELPDSEAGQTARVWELQRLPVAPPRAGRGERKAVERQRQGLILDAVNAFSAREVAQSALAIQVQHPTAPRNAWTELFSIVDRRYARSAYGVSAIMATLLAKRAQRAGSAPKQKETS